MKKPNIFRKITLWFGSVPGSIRKAIDVILPITTKLLKIVESDGAIILTEIIPGKDDDMLRVALAAALREFEALLRRAKGDKQKAKYAAGAVGAYMTSIMDGKQHDMSEYINCFEKVYQEQKTYVLEA